MDKTLRVAAVLAILIIVALAATLCTQNKRQSLQMQAIETSDEYTLHWKHTDGRDAYVHHTYLTGTVVPDWYLQVEVNLAIDGYVIQEQAFVPDITPAEFMVGESWGDAISWEWDTDTWNGIADELAREYWTYPGAPEDEQVMIIFESPGAYHVGGGWYWLRQVEGTGPYMLYFPLVMHYRK